LADHAAGSFSWDEYLAAMRDESTYELGSREPFPEQFNTRVSEAATGFHAAPVELVRGFLLSENFPPETIEVVGNSVVDATRAAVADAERATVFETYPQLASGNFIRFCVHRRENTESAQRFAVLFEALELLVRRGESVLLISLFGTEAAIDEHGFRDRLNALVDEFPETFIYSQVWPNYRDVVAAMLKCAVVATDSGSMQEEMNILGVPCVTLRFGTDRGESLLAGGNVLAPPTNAEFVADIVQYATREESLRNVGNIYGENASQMLVDEVMKRLDQEWGVFVTEEQRLGL
jgi:UDP-N-acetylglucosamine 2-epimerase (non-hydrolysing)